MKRLIVIALLALTCTLSAQREEIETTATIKSVMVYTSSAEIDYEKEILLPKGKSTIVFTNLTPYIAQNSVNVSLSDATVSILTVNELINYTKEKRTVNEQVAFLQDSIRKMKRELGLLKCRWEVVSTEKSLLFKNESIGGLSQGIAVTEIEKASTFFNKRYYELTKELFYLDEKQEFLEDRIALYKSQEKESVTVSVVTTSEIKVSVSSPVAKKVKFNFRFLTPKAGWAPVYDFKYEGPTNPLQFVFRANVFNATGIPWQEVNMKLSTADPTQGFALPSFSENTSAKHKEKEDGVTFKQVELVNAITTYDISHQYSIPSDAKPYLIDVSSYSMPANFNYLLIPKLDPFGFLMGKIPGWNKYNLMPGTANFYNMGSYMGKTFLDTYTENDTFSVYLGKDKNIQMTRTEKNTKNSNFFIGNYFTDVTHTEIILKNNSKENLSVELIDQVPLFTESDEEKLSVFNINNAKYNVEEGMLTWNLKLKPEETLTINYRYEVKAPKEYYDAYKPKKKKYRTVACPSF